jgi:hypothetical protein
MTPQTKQFHKRKERGAVRVLVTLDPKNDGALVKKWLALKAEHGGQKPAIIALLKGVKGE